MGDRSATVDMERKVGAAVALFVGELGSHLTQCRLGWPTSILSGILIHPTLFGHNTPMLQTDRQDNGPVA